MTIVEFGSREERIVGVWAPFEVSYFASLDMKRPGGRYIRMCDVVGRVGDGCIILESCQSLNSRISALQLTDSSWRFPVPPTGTSTVLA